LRDLTPCRTCVDGNNWTKNETFANPLHSVAGARPARDAASTSASLP
jgi:hypothetical protein